MRINSTRPSADKTSRDIVATKNISFLNETSRDSETNTIAPLDARKLIRLNKSACYQQPLGHLYGSEV